MKICLFSINKGFQIIPEGMDAFVVNGVNVNISRQWTVKYQQTNYKYFL